MSEILLLVAVFGLLAMQIAFFVVEDLPQLKQKYLNPYYEKDEVFTELTEKNEYNRNIYEGFIKSKYLKKLTVEDIAMICDDYKINFGYHVDVDKSGKFVCIVWTD